MSILPNNFFEHDASTVAQKLLGKTIHHKYKNIILSAKIIETEAYCLDEKSSHSSLGYTEKRKALFMSPGTIYMYYARGGDSMNVSCGGKGDAVLLKSGHPYISNNTPENMIPFMQSLNPLGVDKRTRPLNKLCSGQTLLCKSLGITVKDWDQKQFDEEKLFIQDVGYQPKKIIQTTRLGIPEGRDEDLKLRFIDFDYANHCTQNPLCKRSWKEGINYEIVDNQE